MPKISWSSGAVRFGLSSAGRWEPPTCSIVMRSRQRSSARWSGYHPCRGADLVLEAAGSISAARAGLDMVRPGHALLVGFGTPVGEMNLLPFEALVRRNVCIQGVWVSDTSHTLQAVSLVRQHPRAFASLVTHRFALCQATAALQAVDDRSALKAVILPQT